MPANGLHTGLSHSEKGSRRYLHTQNRCVPAEPPLNYQVGHLGTGSRAPSASKNAETERPRGCPLCRSEELRSGISNYMALGCTLMRGPVRAGTQEHPERIPALAFFLGGTSSDHQQKQFLLNTPQRHLINPTSKLKYLREKKVQDKLLRHDGKACSQDTSPTMLSNLACVFLVWVLPGTTTLFHVILPALSRGFPLPRRPPSCCDFHTNSYSSVRTLLGLSPPL